MKELYALLDAAACHHIICGHTLAQAQAGALLLRRLCHCNTTCELVVTLHMYQSLERIGTGINSACNGLV